MKHTPLALVLFACLLIPAQPAAAQVVISQVYGGGGNTGAPLKNDFVELFNRGASPVSLTGLSIQYASATGTGNFGTNAITALSGTLNTGQYYLVQLAGGANGVPLPAPDATGTANMSGTGGKIALISGTTGLACNGGSTPCTQEQLDRIQDLVGWDGANFFEGAAAPATSNTTALFRANGGCIDTNNNSADFTAGTPGPRNTASPHHFCTEPTNPAGVGAANPAALTAGDTTLLTVAVTPGDFPPSTGLGVSVDLSPIGGSPAQVFYDNGTNGDLTAGDNIFSYLITVASGTAPGTRTFAVSIADAQGRNGSTSITLTVALIFEIHDIQGAGISSPHQGEVVATTGIVTGVKSTGFFVQTPDAEADGDPNTSEGIFVFTSKPVPAAAVMGNRVKIIGTVQEYVPSADPNSPSTTEIAGSPTVSVLSSGHTLPAPVTLTSVYTNPDGGLYQLERFEGMRVHIDQLVAIAPTDGDLNESDATSTSNGVFYGVFPGVARPFTEPGIEDPDPLPPCCIPRFDGNPERLRVDSGSLIGATPVEVTSGATVAGLTGPLDYAYRTYTIDTDPGAPPAVSGNLLLSPAPDACPAEFTVATSNLARFYDTVNDPDTSDAVLTATAFGNRLNKVSLAIRDVLRFPDIVGVEEVEHLSTLEALANKINTDAMAARQPNPQYEAFLQEGNDIGGIDVGFLVKRSRVNIVDVVQVGKDATYIDPSTNAPALLNDRPPLVLRATVQPPDGPVFPVTVIVNHLRSLSGVEDARVQAKRAAQAEFLANLIQAHQNDGERVISIGDYNATQFSDGYVDVMGTIVGAPAPASEVFLPTTAGLVNPNLTNLLDLAPAEDRYSFLFDGNAQELDHVLVTQNLLSRVNGLSYARVNADFPESYRNDASRPERFSDHDIPIAYFQLPALIVDASVDQATLWPVNHKMVPIMVDYDVKNVCGVVNPVTVSLSVSCNQPVNGTGDGNTSPDWVVVDAHHVQLRAERAGTAGDRIYTITITATDSKGNIATQPVTVTVPQSR